MADEKVIDATKLKTAVKEINGLGVEGVDKIRTVGITKIAMALAFIGACNTIQETDESLLSDFIVEVYNSLPDPAELVEQQEKEKKDKPTKVKKEKVKKDPKPKKEKKVIEKSRYGHLPNAKSGKLDDMLFEGATIKEMMDECEVPRVRVIGHANHIKNDLGLTLLVTENKEDSLLTKLQIKEEKWEGEGPLPKPEKKAKPAKKEEPEEEDESGDEEETSAE